MLLRTIYDFIFGVPYENGYNAVVANKEKIIEMSRNEEEYYNVMKDKDSSE